MSLRVDHVTIAGSHLASLEQAFTGVGLKPAYGGPHSNGITHMDLLSFADGSYIELISTLEPGQTSPLWHAHIAGDGGPCAWAVGVDDERYTFCHAIIVTGEVNIYQPAAPIGGKLERRDIVLSV